MFSDKIDPIMSNGVAKICGKYLHHKGVVAVRWSWTGDEGQIHTNKLKM